MTERLTDLMHRAAGDLRVPPPPTERVVAQGRAVRRTRRRSAAAVVAAVVLVAGVGVGATWRGTSEVEPARPDDTGKALELSGTGPVFAVGPNVVLDGGDLVSRLSGTVSELHYTSAGIVVRYGAAAGRVALVAADGTTRPLPDLPEGSTPASDPDQPYLAYADVVDDVTQVVVMDVSDGREVARVDVPDAPDGSAVQAPAVALDSGTVYTTVNRRTWAVEWPTGDAAVTTRVQDLSSVRGGRTIADRDGTRLVVDMATGELLSLTTGSNGSLSLSPDGQYALVGDRVVDLEDQSSARIGLRGRVGWSPSDQPFVVDGDRLTTCSPTTGDCVETRVDLPDGDDAGSLLLGGEILAPTSP